MGMNVISILHSWGYLALIYWTFCQGEGGGGAAKPLNALFLTII